MSADSAIHGPQYHPRSVTVEVRDGQWCVVDRSYAGAEHVSNAGPRSDQMARARAHTAARRRQATIKAALTRRANKARAAASALDVRRAAACAEAGVTWTYLTGAHLDDHSRLTPAEADAWLGIDS